MNLQVEGGVVGGRQGLGRKRLPRGRELPEMCELHRAVSTLLWRGVCMRVPGRGYRSQALGVAQKWGPFPPKEGSEARKQLGLGDFGALAGPK